MSKQRTITIKAGQVRRTSGSTGSRYYFDDVASGYTYTASRPTDLRKSLTRKGIDAAIVAEVVEACRQLADDAKSARLPFKVYAGGAMVSEHATEQEAVAACKALEPQYDDFAAPSVVRIKESGTYKSSQTVYPVRGEIHSN